MSVDFRRIPQELQKASHVTDQMVKTYFTTEKFWKRFREEQLSVVQQQWMQMPRFLVDRFIDRLCPFEAQRMEEFLVTLQGNKPDHAAIFHLFFGFVKALQKAAKKPSVKQMKLFCNFLGDYCLQRKWSPWVGYRIFEAFKPLAQRKDMKQIL